MSLVGLLFFRSAFFLVSKARDKPFPRFAVYRILIDNNHIVQTRTYPIDPKLQPDILLAPFVLKKIGPAVFFNLCKPVAPAGSFIIIFLFPPKGFKERGFFQVREGGF